MRPGAIELTVIPRGPSSRDSDFAQPMTPGRTAFESARLSVGSFTVLDVMFTMRPAGLRSRWGRQRPVSRTTETRSRRTAASTCSVCEPDRRRARRTAGVVHEDVDAAEGVDRGSDEPLEVLGDRDVSGNRQPAEPRQPLARAAPAGART